MPEHKLESIEQCKHITGSTRKRVILLTKASGGKVHDKRQLDEADRVGYMMLTAVGL